MAFIADYLEPISRKTVESCYCKIVRIWGSKEEGWNAWVGIFKDKKNMQSPLFSYPINNPYVDGKNPFEILYPVAILDPRLTNVKNDEIELVEPQVEEQPVQVKKTRTKKNSA